MFDLIVIGGGPGGLSSAVFAASEGLRVALIEGGEIGGQARDSALIENYLGFPIGTSGHDLMVAGASQARRFGVQLIGGNAVLLNKQDKGIEVIHTQHGTSQFASIFGKTVVVASGVEYRALPNLPASGTVHYGLGTWGFPGPYTNVAVLGGANSAGQAAFDLSDKAEKVVLFTRSPLEKGMSRYMVDKISAIENIEIVCTDGHDLVPYYLGHGLVFEQTFAFIGGEPRSGWFPGMKDNKGRILTGADVPLAQGERREAYETSIPGVFAVGDVRHGSTPRVASAAGEGAAVIASVHSCIAAGGH